MSAQTYKENKFMISQLMRWVSQNKTKLY